MFKINSIALNPILPIKKTCNTNSFIFGWGCRVGVVSVEKKSEWLPKSKSDDQHKSMTIP